MDKIELRAAADRLMYENSHNMADYNMLIEYIDHSEAIKPDKDWISVKDRLPDDKKRYLICTESRMDNIEIAYYQPIGDKFSDYEPFWQGDSCRFTTSVTHWQPLPKRPKGE